MARIDGSPVSATYRDDRAADRSSHVDTKPAFRKGGGTRKRAGAVVAAALASMAQSFWGVPDQTRPRAASESRRPNHKLRQQINSLLDQLLVGREQKLPSPIQGLHLLLGEIATIKYGVTPEQSARPFADAYLCGGSRQDLLLLNQRLDVLAGAESLFATMNETNRQDVKGVIAALKRSALQELAAQGIGEPLRLLAGRLGERDLEPRSITKAWFALEEGVRLAYREGLDSVPYLQAGLERLPFAATRVLAAVLAPLVPAHARVARYLLDRAIHETPRDTPAMDVLQCLDTGTVQEAVRAHIVSCLDAGVDEMARKLENAVRPGFRTAEIANRVWSDMRHTVDILGWVYLDGVDGDDAWEEAAVDAETERRFVRALEQMHRDAVGACLAGLDAERLIAMYAHRGQWSEAQCLRLAELLDAARDGRMDSLKHGVAAARLHVDAALAQDRRIATAHALVGLSDALAARERFACLTGASHAWNEDASVDATILRAAASLRIAGEPTDALGRLSLGGLRDAAFADLRHCGDGIAFRGLSLDPVAVAAEIRRRGERLDATVEARLAQFSELLRGPALAPHPFIGMVAAVARADVARSATLASFGGDAIVPTRDPVQAGSSPRLNRALATVLYRKDGAMPVQWLEARRHIGGLLTALRQVRASLGTDSSGPTAIHPGTTLDTAISMLQVLGRHFGINLLDQPGAIRAPSTSSDPYWNEGCLPDAAAVFGIRFDAARRRAVPLFGPMHRARLVAALGTRMAQPALPGFEEIAAPTQAGPRTIRIDKGFHDAAYRRGELSLSVEGSPVYALGALADMAGRHAATLTRLMAAVAQGLDDFTASARTMPAMSRWLRIAEPAALRHVHFDVSDVPTGGYRVDVSAALDTRRPDTDASLAFALQVHMTGHQVMRLIVPPELRLSPSELHLSRTISSPAVTTAGRGADRVPGDKQPLLVAAGS
jgi:hypothetical protein